MVMKAAVASNTMKSFESRYTRLLDEAPITLRMLTSFTRFLTVNTTVPNRPRQAMVMANNPMKPHIFTILP